MNKSKTIINLSLEIYFGSIKFKSWKLIFKNLVN